MIHVKEVWHTMLPGMPGIKPVPVPKPKAAEDIPGVPTAAWARVKRGVPASDPFKPGEGFMLMVDGARFLPGMTNNIATLLFPIFLQS